MNISLIAEIVVTVAGCLALVLVFREPQEDIEAVRTEINAFRRRIDWARGPAELIALRKEILAFYHEHYLSACSIIPEWKLLSDIDRRTGGSR